MILDLGLASLAGLLSFASTCVLPLVPAYITYMGAAAVGTETTVGQQLKVLGKAALFVAGFATAFVALGASFGLIGADLSAYRPLLLAIAGVDSKKAGAPLPPSMNLRNCGFLGSQRPFGAGSCLAPLFLGDG